MSLNCEECTKSNNHCCLADIPHSEYDAIYYKTLADKLGLNVILVSHPKHEDKLVFATEDMNNTDITRQNCVFLKEGKCLIYDDRPTICRSYGTEVFNCRYTGTAYEHATKDELNALTDNDLMVLDKAAFDKTDIDEIIRYKGK